MREGIFEHPLSPKGSPGIFAPDDPNLRNINLSTITDIDQKVEHINQVLQKAFEEACPITYISNTVRKPPWLTPEIEEAQRGIRRKLMTARTNKSTLQWLALRESNKQYNKIVSQAQRDAWRTFCKDTESVKQSTRMSKFLKSCNDNKEKQEAVYKTNGDLTTSAEETLEVMASVHFKESVSAPPTNPDNPHPITQDLINKIYSPDRLEQAVSTFEPYKAAGPDTFKPIIIQKAWKHIKDLTRTIMMKNHETQHIPTLWRNSLGIFLPKPGKSDYNQPKSFRTITLSPVMLKLQD